MTTSNLSALAHTVAEVRDHIAAACERSGRNVDDVGLIAVTKTVGSDTVQELAHLPGALACNQFGENRVQELARKLEACPDQTFHFIGTLQRNKVADVVGRVALIHSVDSYRLLDAIDRRACALDIIQDVLLQVNVSGERTKHGFEPDEVPEVIAYARTLKGIRVTGLMTMAPFGKPEESRPYFRSLFKLGQEMGSGELSMGMSNDYEVAIEEGATLIRVGSALFRSA